MRERNTRVGALVVTVLLALSTACPTEAQDKEGDTPSFGRKVAGKGSRLVHTLLRDQANYYCPETLMRLGLSLGAADALANTSADTDIQDWYQNAVGQTQSLKDFSAVVKPFGGRILPISLALGGALLGEMTGDWPIGSTVGRWGRRTLRTFLVGGPPMLLLQRGIGSARPGREEYGSSWRPFENHSGVSGHSFMGACPLITAAKMTDKLYWKVLFYGLSALPALSRIQDNQHYFSQVAMGWWMAYVAASSVDKTDSRLTVFPITAGEVAVGGGVSIRF